MTTFTSFQLAREKKILGAMKYKLIKGKEVALVRDKYQVGDLVSVDQFMVGLPGRIL